MTTLKQIWIKYFAKEQWVTLNVLHETLSWTSRRTGEKTGESYHAYILQESNKGNRRCLIETSVDTGALKHIGEKEAKAHDTYRKEILPWLYFSISEKF